MTVIFTVFHIYCAFEELPRKPNKLNSVLKFSLIFPFLLTAYAKLYQHNGLISGSEIDHSFESAIYFSVITFTTLGYGDFQPTPDIRLWAAGEALIGYIVIAMLIGFTLNLLNSKFKNV